MMPMDIGISNSKSNATQFGDTRSGASLIVGDPQSWLKLSIVGGLGLLAFVAFLIVRK